MKILHLSYSISKGGASRAALRIHQSLLKKKINSFFQVSIINSPQLNLKNIIKPGLLRSYFNKIKSVIESIVSKILRKNNFVKNSISLFPTYMHKFINKSDYDIIHLHWINGETISIEDIGKITKPLVWTIQDMWPFAGSEHYTFKKYWKYRYSNNNKNVTNLINIDIEKFTWKRKIKNWKKKINIVGTSEWITNCASSSYLMKKFPAVTINNTLDVNFWKSQNKKGCKKYFNLPENKRILGFSSLGHNNEILKGKDLFLSAIKKINYDPKKIALFSIGDSNEFSEIKNINDIQIFNMRRLNNDLEIRRFYNCLDLIIVPSRLEAFGQTASEAISCGIPVVCFNSTGLKDIIVHKKNGYLAKLYSSKELGEGIEYILKLNQQKYKKMCLSAIKVAHEKFSFDFVSDQYVKLYKKILTHKDLNNAESLMNIS
jgi:glycosyltransferase involved in cell wall biosynthesis